MDFSGLSFYQSILRGRGIKHILKNEPEKDKKPSRPRPVPSETVIDKSRLSGAPGPAATDLDIPAACLEYRRPAYSVWSYYNLPQDIEKGFTNSRGDLINKIIESLEWSRRAYTFWPLTRAAKNGLAPDSAFFLEGMRQINPVHVFIFGSKAFNVLLKDHSFRYGPHQYKDLRIIALPALEALLPDNRLLKAVVWNILKKFTPQQY